MRVLLISYAYPPISAPGAIRVSKWRNYLPEFGWEPTVLTVEGGYSRMKSGENLEDDAVIRVPDAPWKSKVSVSPAVATSKKKPSLKSALRKQATYLMFPDRDRTWIKPAYSKLLELLQTTHFDAMISSSPTMTNHVIASQIQKKFNIPWLADFRDPWVYGAHYEAPFWRRGMDRNLEASILANAQAITCVSNFIQQMFQEHYPRDAKKIHVIFNGYDEKDLETLTPTEDPNQFSLIYAGSFYGGRRNPQGLFQAISELAKEGKITPEKFVLKLVGDPEGTIVEMVNNAGISNFVAFEGMKNYAECLQMQASSTALLAITASDPLSKGELTTKLFEYLGLKKPILALTPKDFELGRMVEDYRSGAAIDPGDTTSIKNWLLKSIQGERPPLDANPESLSRRAGTQKLASILESIAN
jgi:glycosyltransferase involved in cell wall biosynthesis